jgi:nucleotide-binding universal stress UspA family protein
MANAEPGESYRRVVVALDASPASRALLDAAAALAARHRAELVGLFIEDLNLLNMSALPFTRVAGAGPLSSGVDRATVERLLRRASAEMREVLAGLAERAPVPWSFRVVRELTMRALTGAAGEAGDLLVVADAALAGGLRSFVVAARASVLCLRPARIEGASEVLVPWREGMEGARALHAAAALAEATRRPLTVLLPADAAAAREAQSTIERAVAGTGVALRLLRPETGPRSFAEIARRHPGAVIVWPRAGAAEAGAGAELDAIIEIAHCSVLVVH